MRRQTIGMLCATASLSSCHICKLYDRLKGTEISGLYQDIVSVANTLVPDTANFGNLPWREVFTDPRLQALVEQGLTHNIDLLAAALEVREAQASLALTCLAHVPSLGLSPQEIISSFDRHAVTKIYSLPAIANREIDLFGKLLNVKRDTQVALLQAKAYRQAVQTRIILGIANTYYTSLMLDRQLDIIEQTADIVKRNVETMQAMKDTAMFNTTSAGVGQSKAAYVQVLTFIPATQRSIHETGNTMSMLLAQAPRTIQRGVLEEQQLPEEFLVGVPLQLLSDHPDVRTAEMAPTSTYYNANSAHATFYPQITVSGPVGWINSAGSAIVNPGKLLASILGSFTQLLFYRDVNIARLKIAKAQREEAKLAFQQSILNAGSEVSNAPYQYQSASEETASRKMQVESSGKVSEYIKELFKLGASTYLEVLSAEQSSLSTRLSQVGSTFDRMQAVVSLYQALGGGRED